MTSLPLLCVLIALPFVSATVIVLVPRLYRLPGRHPRISWTIGAIGLGVLLIGMLGLLPRSVALPLMLAGGVVSGYSMFWAPQERHPGDDWRRGPGGPDTPPPLPLDSGPDWQLFDLLRSEWEREPSPASDE